MTRSDKALYLGVLKSLGYTIAKGFVLIISLGLLAFVGFHILAL